MSDFYLDSHRELQDRFDTRRLADRLDEALVHDTILESDKAFIESRDMFFLATVDARGHVSCSYRGGDPGFVRVVDEHTIAFPNYDGNGMYQSMGNVASAGQVGILFIDFAQPRRLRFNGVATIDHGDPLKSEFPEAQFVVRVRAREIFNNCPRYIHKMKLIERSRFVPKSGCPTPVPGWKTGEWVADVLPENDPARDKSREVI
ncbi:MAG: pyridoxamine 5'-phosphate oxidase family protein [Pseudomonadota bacterium]|nr:MAG: pyridoxamine 5'-phosphate oxidase family protein [Pseudomonadota bacterium]